MRERREAFLDAAIFYVTIRWLAPAAIDGADYLARLASTPMGALCLLTVAGVALVLAEDAHGRKVRSRDDPDFEWRFVTGSGPIYSPVPKPGRWIRVRKAPDGSRPREPR